ncbi:MAG: glycosyltransferase, partial [Terriglobia bacterium]
MAAQPQKQNANLMVSIVIPTWNEEATLELLLEDLAELGVGSERIGAGEIWVADGGSTDRTQKIAERYARLVVTERNRGLQLNAGAERARGETLLFLHADVRFPPDGLEALRRTLADLEVVGGTFSLRYAGDGLPSRVFTRVNRW